jgi:SAM-dependent methyltransferase
MDDITSADRQPFKAAMRTQWDACASGWDAHTADIHAWLRVPTEAMFAMAGVGPGARVLDVAAGAGDQTVSLAQRVGPTGRVLATDLSPAILAFARARAEGAGLANVDTLAIDGEALDLAPASFDAAICRLGLMFFPQPLAGLREIHRALRPGGGLCTMVFSRPEKNPCLTTLMSTALKHAGLPARDPFVPGGLMSLGKPGHMEAIFCEAGFHDVATTAVDATFHMVSVDDYLSFVRSAGGPILQILGRLDPVAAEDAWAEIRERLSAFNTENGWEGPNELLLTAGRRAREMP